MADLLMSVGNRLPTFAGQLLNADGTSVDLTGYDVFLVVRAVDGGTVFGVPSPLVDAATITDGVNGGCVYDWSQIQVDAARAGVYEVSVRAIGTLDPDDTFEMAPARGARIIIRSSPSGENYLVTEAGVTVLTESGQPVVV